MDEISDISELPLWGFDGSSTQAVGEDSDCVLKPVAFYNDPSRGWPHVLVMTEVMTPRDMQPHTTNHRAACAEMATKHEVEECILELSRNTHSLMESSH